jgi:hypothetical protein
MAVSLVENYRSGLLIDWYECIRYILGHRHQIKLYTSNFLENGIKRRDLSAGLL